MSPVTILWHILGEGQISHEADVAKQKAGGEGWIRTSVRLRGQIYSLLPLTSRPPLHGAGRRAMWRRVNLVSTRLRRIRMTGAMRRARYAPRPIARVRSSTSTCHRHVGAGAGEGNRTLVVSLEGFCSTIELHPPARRRDIPLPPPCRCVNRSAFLT
jgi:hypothetical protein